MGHVAGAGLSSSCLTNSDCLGLFGLNLTNCGCCETGGGGGGLVEHCGQDHRAGHGAGVGAGCRPGVGPKLFQRKVISPSPPLPRLTPQSMRSCEILHFCHGHTFIVNFYM